MKSLMNGTRDHHRMLEIKYFTAEEKFQMLEGLEEEVSDEAGSREG